MTIRERDQIIARRIDAYRRRMVESNATPMICLGVGQGDRLGELVICITEDMPLDTARDLLKGAVQLIQERIDSGGRSD